MDLVRNFNRSKLHIAIFLLVAILILPSLSFISAERFGYGTTETIPINYSNIIINETSNQSEYWNTNIGSLGGVNSTQFENQGGDLNIKTSWLETFVNALSKWSNYWTKTENIDQTGYNITADYFKGDGSELTGIDVSYDGLTYQARHYPPEYNINYVKAEQISSSYEPWFSVDPSKSITGAVSGQQWYGNAGTKRFHIDLGEAKTIRMIYYVNSHNAGGTTDRGAKDFTFWGSNEQTSFDEMTYGTDTGWTELTVSSNTFDRHVEADVEDKKYIKVSNNETYRYYAVKIANNYGSSFVGIRHIELWERPIDKVAVWGENSLEGSLIEVDGGDLYVPEDLEVGGALTGTTITGTKVNVGSGYTADGNLNVVLSSNTKGAYIKTATTSDANYLLRLENSNRHKFDLTGTGKFFQNGATQGWVLGSSIFGVGTHHFKSIAHATTNQVLAVFSGRPADVTISGGYAFGVLRGNANTEGIARFILDADWRAGIGFTPAQSTGPYRLGAYQLSVYPDAVGTTGLRIKGRPSQTADFVNFDNSAGTTLFLVDKDGNIDTAGNVTAEDFITRSKVADTKEDYLSKLNNMDKWIKDGKIQYEEHYAYTPFEARRKIGYENVTAIMHECEETEGDIQVCREVEYQREEPVYEYYMADGLSMETRTASIEGMFGEYLKGGRPITLGNNKTGFDTNVILADEIYTKSKVVQIGVDYVLRFLDLTKLTNKENHKNLVTLDDGRQFLDAEARWVDTEGALYQIIKCTELHKKYDDYRSCMGFEK